MARAASAKDDDEVVTFLALVVAGIAVLGSAGALWLTGTNWLVSHQVLVTATAAPALAVPYAAGAGLDWPRLQILVGTVLGIAAFAGSAMRTAVVSRRRRS